MTQTTEERPLRCCWCERTIDGDERVLLVSNEIGEDPDYLAVCEGCIGMDSAAWQVSQ
jgi:hypothetical protein